MASNTASLKRKVNTKHKKASEKEPKEKKQKALLKDRFYLTTPFDYELLIVTVLLSIFGLIMIYSSSYSYAVTAYKYKATHFFTRQLMFVGFGMAVLLVLSFLRMRRFSVLTPFFAVGALFIIFLVRSGIGHASHGAYRWIIIAGVQIQVAEIVKLLLIFSMAGMMSRFRSMMPMAQVVMVIFCIAVGGMVGVVSKNMSTGVIIAMIGVMMLFITSDNWLLYVFVALGVLAFFLLVVFIYVKSVPYVETENFRITRLRAFLEPNDIRFAQNQALQSTQALYAVSTGGFFGKGLGKSLLKFVLPEPHNDYILSILFEELGIFGVIILLLLYGFLLYKIFKVYYSAKIYYNKCLVLGVFCHLTLQLILNFMVAVGLVPTMGVTLPFISYGGSAVLCTLAEIGIVFSVQRETIEEQAYEEADKEIRREDPEYDEIVTDHERLRRDKDLEKRRKVMHERRKKALNGRRKK